MKITKLILLDPTGGQGIKRYELETATLFSEDYAELRAIVDKLNLLETHETTNEEIKGRNSLTLVIETNEISKIISIPTEYGLISEELDDLVNMVRGGKKNNVMPFQPRSSKII
jgi:hypothetical protein